jgi:transcription elongation GreA/GreB family factor
MTRFLFIKDDYEDFCKKIQEIKQKIKEVTMRIGTVVDSSGDQWHDASLYQAQGMSESWSNELRKLLEIQKQSHIIDIHPPKDGKVRFGKIVEILNLDNREASTYEISSYIIPEHRQIEDNRKRISYTSPLAQLLIGAEVGEIREGYIGKDFKRFEIMRINE